MKNLVTFDVEFDQPPRRASLLLRGECTATIEVRFLEIDEPVKAKFERRTGAARANGYVRRQEIDVGGNETRFNS